MPVSVVVGGQYGSEGKGKVALHIAKSMDAAAVVRVGGPNSGHTGVDEFGKAWILRQLPAASLAKNSIIVLPAGSLIDPDILLHEIDELGIDPDRLVIDGQATVITPEHRKREIEEHLPERIGSTGSGTGAALRERLARTAGHVLASHHAMLKAFTRDFTAGLLRDFLLSDKRVVVEGTQGFGLSLWHGTAYPYRDDKGNLQSFFLSKDPKVKGDELDVRSEFVVRPNSLCYVTLKPKFRMPAYLAARFNLLIRDVYRGFLVGTGPLVDPGFVGFLSIPLHNFTSNEYILRAGERKDSVVRTR